MLALLRTFSWQELRHHPWRNAAAVLAVMIEGVVELNLGDSEVLTMFLAIAACGYLALEAGKEDKILLSHE